MNKAQISNILRKIGLLYPLDKLRYWLIKKHNLKANLKFKSENLNIALPPDYLMYESFQMNYQKYYFGGRETAEWIYRQIETHINLKGRKILDWGCGPGRVIRHMFKVSKNQSKFYGTDYNEKSIQWCRNNIKNVEFNLNSLEAKLPYEDDFFDAIYGISIFTHLSKEMHFKWLNELKRVIKPEGIILITTHGDNFKTKLSIKEKRKFEKGELVVRGNVKEGHRMFCTFHPDQFLKSFFKEFEILDKIVISTENKSFIPQDRWILKKTVANNVYN
jgi:ubiquinone/menaquinone biosynthesis C-methylase UbiE